MCINRKINKYIYIYTNIIEYAYKTKKPMILVVVIILLLLRTTTVLFRLESQHHNRDGL